jgi:hypothetical protein
MFLSMLSVQIDMYVFINSLMYVYYDRAAIVLLKVKYTIKYSKKK